MTELVKKRCGAGVERSPSAAQAREEKKIQLVLFTSDRGLCGGYNANLIRAAEAFMRSNAGEKEVELTLVGRKGADHFRRRRAEIADRYIEYSGDARRRVGGGDRAETDQRVLSAAKPMRSIFFIAGFARRCRRCRLWKSFCP